MRRKTKFVEYLRAGEAPIAEDNQVHLREHDYPVSLLLRLEFRVDGDARNKFGQIDLYYGSEVHSLH